MEDDLASPIFIYDYELVGIFIVKSNVARSSRYHEKLIFNIGNVIHLNLHLTSIPLVFENWYQPEVRSYISYVKILWKLLWNWINAVNIIFLVYLMCKSKKEFRRRNLHYKKLFTCMNCFRTISSKILASKICKV